MAEEVKEPEVKVESTEPEPVKTEPDVSTNTETKEEVKTEPKKDIMIPKERFDEVNGKYKELSTQIKDMQDAKAEMEKQLADMKEASEKTSTSITETTSKLEGQVKQYETLIGEMVTQKMAGIPEEMQDLIPDGLSSEQKLSWLNKAEAKGLFKKEEKPKAVIGQPLNHSSEQDKSERIKKMNPLQLFTSYYGEKK
jgi:septal ring factor EnvC (AmiA/AmiB activator)